MAEPLKCPKGHWFNPDVFGGQCPACKAKAPRSDKPLSEDDVLAILDTPADPPAEAKAAEPDLALRKRKKFCPACKCEISYSFGYCPRCGGPLELASIKMPPPKA